MAISAHNNVSWPSVCIFESDKETGNPFSNNTYSPFIIFSFICFETFRPILSHTLVTGEWFSLSYILLIALYECSSKILDCCLAIWLVPVSVSGIAITPGDLPRADILWEMYSRNYGTICCATELAKAAWSKPWVSWKDVASFWGTWWLLKSSRLTTPEEWGVCRSLAFEVGESFFLRFTLGLVYGLLETRCVLPIVCVWQSEKLQKLLLKYYTSTQ